MKAAASFRQPLGLRCIFYKGAAAGAGFHSPSLSVCLGLRGCWVSPCLGMRWAHGGRREGLEGACGLAEPPCPLSSLVVDSPSQLGTERRERERVSSCLSLAFRTRWPGRHGEERSPGLRAGGSGWNPPCGFLSSWPRAVLVAGLRGRERVGRFVAHCPCGPARVRSPGSHSVTRFALGQR